jgi:uncharacterized membrane protein YhaH (DUF805 family)
MLRSLFGLKGEVGRLAFVGWNLALFLAAILVTLVFVAVQYALAFAFGLRSQAASWVMAGVTAVLVLVPYLWVGIALQAKRLRHMGWPPVPILVGLLALTAAEMALRARMPIPLPDPLSRYSLIQILAYLVLVVWPGRSGAAIAPSGRARRELPRPADGSRARFGLRA